MKNIAVLGSTGSIGVNAVKVIQANPEKYRAVALAAGKNIERLKKQIEDLNPSAVSLILESMATELKQRLIGNKVPDIFFGNSGCEQLATLDKVDTVISAITGAAGLVPTYKAIKAGKHVALANKETMVMAGSLVMAEARKQGVSVIPVDSEHSAILQSLQGHRREDLRRVILTASGGPFRNLGQDEMARVTPAQALKHPNWNMGPKISIDSATMMNKGLEVIEAKWFFDLDVDQISILIHPQSIVHSMTEYRDGSVIAHMGIPDMMIPISYALSFPRHIDNQLPRLELATVGTLSFEEPDLKKFRCLYLALQAAKIGGSMAAVLNGANEIAVEAFLAGKIGFSEIPTLIEETMNAHHPYPVENLEMVMEADRWAREKAGRMLARLQI